jgi:hypothetical protein
LFAESLKTSSEKGESSRLRINVILPAKDADRRNYFPFRVIIEKDFQVNLVLFSVAPPAALIFLDNYDAGVKQILVEY